MTNFEKIKSMNIDDMSAVIGMTFINIGYGSVGCDGCPGRKLCVTSNSDERCPDVIKRWLNEKVEEPIVHEIEKYE
jgi:hypothetical protein